MTDQEFADSLCGLEKRDSQNKVEARGLMYRLVSVDGEKFLGEPSDVRTDRICVEITGRNVSRAWVG